LAKELDPFKVSLTHAVHFYIRHAPKLNNVRVNEVIPTYLKRKENDTYRKAQSVSLNVFARDFGNKAISSIVHGTLQSWFDKQGWEPLNQRNYMRDIGMFFKWCKNNDFCMVNPMERVVRPRVKIKTPQIYTVDEAECLLTIAKEHPELKLQEFVAFAFFTGIRVEELEKMTWDMVVWQQAEVCLPETVTKTHRPRMIPIIDALRSWVPEAQRTGPLFDKTNLRNRKEALFNLAGFEAKKNAFRHTFASYHAAHHRNFSELQMILGQRTPSILFTHYVAATRREEAARFFALLPDTRLEGEEVLLHLAIADTPL
jgi:integrase